MNDLNHELLAAKVQALKAENLILHRWLDEQRQQYNKLLVVYGDVRQQLLERCEADRAID